MGESGDWLTPRLNRVRYFDKPPLQYWLMASGFPVGGVSPFTARAWSALAAVACAAVTAQIGVILGGPRVGLLAGLMTAANLGIFLYGRLVKPDLLFVLCLTLAQAGFVLAYLGRGGRRGLVLFYVALGLAALAKDLIAALGLLATVALFLRLIRERPLASWWPWWGIGLFAVTALPWYLAVEVSNRGFIWYTLVDNHLLNFTRHRVFPDEDVPLGSLEFLAVSVAFLLPWSLAAPWAVIRSFRRDWEAPVDRLWLLFALWVVLVIGFFTVSPFKLPHYALPAFPALALLVARVWEDTMTAAPRAVRPRALLAPIAVVFAVAAATAAALWSGRLGVSRRVVAILDVTTRNLAALGASVPELPLDALRSVLALCAIVFGLGALALGLAIRRRSAELGVTVVLAAMLAFLPAAGKGMAEFARARSAEPIGLGPGATGSARRRDRPRGGAGAHRVAAADPPPARSPGGRAHVEPGFRSHLSRCARGLLGRRPGARELEGAGASFPDLHGRGREERRAVVTVGPGPPLGRGGWPPALLEPQRLAAASDD